MLTTMNGQEKIHWRDRAISWLEIFSDAFEVFKAAGARLAEWVLYICLIANVVEVVSSDFRTSFGTYIMAAQTIMLDIAGFGLATMADSAKRRGDDESAKKGGRVGKMLIGITVVTVGLVTLTLIDSDKSVSNFVTMALNVLIFVRVLVTIFYSHIMHSMKGASTVHLNRTAELERALSSVQSMLSNEQKKVSSVQSELSSLEDQLSSVQEKHRKELSSVQLELSSEQDKVSSLQHQLDRSTAQLSNLENQLDSDQGDVSTLKHNLAIARSEVSGLTGRIEGKDRELSSVQSMLSSEQRKVSSLENQVSSLKLQLDKSKEQVSSYLSSQRAQVSSPVSNVVSSQDETGQDNIVQFESKRKAESDKSIEERVRDYHTTTPVQSVSARDIAEAVGCSPTKASEWKKKIIEEETDKVVNG